MVFGETLQMEEVSLHDGDLHTYSSIKFPLLDESGSIYAVCGIATDITRQKQQEQLLRRTQKMDALGKLTGGIAHDYNNMLGVITGYSELLKSALVDNRKLFKFASEIHRASERGASLTRKLLAFSRPQKSANQSVDLNQLIRDREDMLQKVLTARIELELDLAENIWPVWINAGDMEDAVVNMCINAMHAMENGGQLTIKTTNQQLDEQQVPQRHAQPGDYALLAISDTGIGMDRATQEKMFDPFFSSKGDLGAGLGLSQVYALVKNNGGFIQVHSEPGHGTRMSIYLPRYHGSASHPPGVEATSDERMDGSDSILVVDDEQSLCDLAEDILSQHGYRVFTARNATQALAILSTEQVDILFTDVIMPEMDGYQLAHRVRRDYPHIKIQLTSGYNELHATETADGLQISILQKPYRASDLLKCIRDLRPLVN
jgi:signal transduction histidine kinase